ncbi:RHS repeat-associated core domain-containing protein [uncultured Maribacter sp.]|uniref:RHS repeat domain-containing protein n=1 Tax=uncultured Maribacter sp. TaxID=431308 RepID=UPI00262987FE|nr:RHS repeat-associated core domain-containing protein [uncultured Maribacter sp.]
MVSDAVEPVDTDKLVSWVFDYNSFVPAAKIVNGNTYSIACDHLGTPVQAYNQTGEKVWERQLDIYGATKHEQGETNFIPFLYQGQFLDSETGLAYNRFRYYSPDTGTYISQDPIGLAGNNPNLYAYTKDSNRQLDIFGLDTFYQLFNDSGDLVYEGITERNIQDRLTEHASDGKGFSQVKYVDDLDSRAASRNMEGSSLFHNKNNSGQLNKRRLDGGFYHSYDPENIKDGRKFLSQVEIDAKMKNAKVSDVDVKGKMKCH